MYIVTIKNRIIRFNNSKEPLFIFYKKNVDTLSRSMRCNLIRKLRMKELVLILLFIIATAMYGRILQYDKKLSFRK